MARNEAPNYDLTPPPSYEEAMHGHDSYAGASAPVLTSPERPSKASHGQHSVGPVVPVGPVAPVAPVAPPPVANVPPVRQGASNAQSGSGTQPPVPMIVMPTTTVYVSPPPLGPSSVSMVCPVCHKQIRTTTIRTNTSSAHIICILMCLFGCWYCSCLPYCSSCFEETHHKCPNCRSHLGTFCP